MLEDKDSGVKLELEVKVLVCIEAWITRSQ